MHEMGGKMAVLTETWIRDGSLQAGREEEFREKYGLCMITRNRRPNENGVSYRGWLLCGGRGPVSFRKVRINNPGGFEVLVGSSQLPGHRRKLVVIGAYLPPNYARRRGGGRFHWRYCGTNEEEVSGPLPGPSRF